MDKTTLTLAVDSTQVNSASAALQKMAGEGFKAETVVAKLANTAQLQGRALNSGIVKNATAAADSIKGLTSATSALASARDFNSTTSGLAAAAAQANAATGAVRAFSAAVSAAAASSASLSIRPAAPTATKLQDAVQSPASPTTMAGFVNQRMLPLTRQFKAEGLSDTEAYEKALEKVSAEWKHYEQTAVAAQQAVAAKTDATTTAVVANAAQIKNTTQAVNALNAAAGKAPAPQSAVAAATSASTAGPAVSTAAAAGANAKQTSAVGDAASKSAKQVDELGRSVKQVAEQHKIAAVQVKDFFEQVVAGGSPVRAFAMQGAAVVSNYGGFSNTLKSLSSLLTPVRIGIGGVAAAVGTLALAYYEGAKQSKAFADAVVLSGNFAGQTEGKINAMAKGIAESTNSSIGSIREYANALISTGQIGPQVFTAATQAAAAYGKVTGKTAEEVAGDFAKMAQGPTKFAEEINRSMNLFTAAEMDGIKAMEENGRAADAQGVIYAKLIERLKGLEPNLGIIEKALRAGKNAWSSWWDAALGIGRAETVEDRIEKLKKLAAAGQPETGLGAVPAQSRTGILRNQKAQEAAAEVKDLQRRQFRESENADAKAIDAEVQKQAIAADKVVESYLKRGKAQSEYKKKSEELERSFKARDLAGVPVSKADQAVARTELKKEFTPAKGGGRANNEASQVLREQLAEDISAIKAALDAEQRTIEFQQKYLQGVYQAGNISLKDFYDNKRATIAAGVKAQLDELDKEIARLEKYKGQIKDASEKVKTQRQIDQTKNEKEKVSTAGARDTVLANQEAADSFKRLNDQVGEFKAGLLQLAGDEYGAAQMRAQVAVRNARELAARSGGAISPAEVALFAQLTVNAVKLAEVQRRAGNVSQTAAKAEEAVLLAADVGGKSLLETENAIYGVRSKEVAQLGVLARSAADLAKVSGDPKVKQFAVDLAVQYAKAANAMDPALNRLREAQKELASGITNGINTGISGFGQAYTDQRKQANDELKSDKDKYDQKINILEGYLATTQDKNDQARLREKIKNLEAQKDSAKGESKGSSFLKTVNKQFIQPIAGQAMATVNKLLVTDPLQKYLEGQFKGLSEGDGLFAGFFKKSLGIKDAKIDSKALADQAATTAIQAQTTAVQSSTSAMMALAAAANKAAGTTGSDPNKPIPVEPGAKPAIPALGDAAKADKPIGDGPLTTGQAADQATIDARAATSAFGNSATIAASDVNKLAQAASLGGSSLGVLPGVLRLISSAMTAFSSSTATSSATSSSGGIFSSIGKWFSSSGSTASSSAASDAVLSSVYHSGGVVGGPAASRMAPSAIFDGAHRYHTGGIAGQAPDGARAAIAAALKHGEVPAILMKNEEVLRRDDPRHRENLGSDVFAKLMQSKGDNSASVLQGLLARMGVKDEDHTRSGALKVSGARELGGPVSAGKLYRVNEKRPELLNVSGKQYLMMGSQNGKVDPNPQMGGGHTINQTINFMSTGTVNHQTQQQLAAQAARGVQRGGRNL